MRDRPEREHHLLRTHAAELSLWAGILGLLFVAFHLLGNTVENVHSRSVFVWMVVRWGDRISFGADYSHGWLIPLGSIAAIWWRRAYIAQAPRRVAPFGLAIVAGALLMHWVGAKVQQPRISLMALIVLLWSIPYSFYGWELARWLIFPCSYLIFCIPLNFLDGLTFPLRLFSTTISTHLLNGLGITATQSGCAIYSTAGEGFHFDVADPCSGLRSLLALAALIAAYSYFTQKTLLRKWLLFLVAVPIAMAGNVIRITSIALIAVSFGHEHALKIYHDYSGYLIFGAAVILMVGAGNVIQKDYRALLNRWKHTA
jgi:exosortase